MTASDVTVTAVSAGVAAPAVATKSAAASSLRVNKPAALQVYTTSTCVVSYTVTVPNIYAAGFSSVSLTCSTSENTIVSSVSSGSFATDLTANAQATSGSNLGSVTVVTIPSIDACTATTETFGTSGNGSQQKTLSDGGIAAVVIVVFAVVAAVIIGSFYYYRMHNVSQNRGEDATQGQEMASNTKYNPDSSVSNTSVMASGSLSTTSNPILQREQVEQQELKREASEPPVTKSVTTPV